MRPAIHFILDENKNVVPENDVVKWAHWWEANRVLFTDMLSDTEWVITIFNGLDHNCPVGPQSPEYKPAYFSTAHVRGGTAVSERHYPTYEDALAGHHVVLEQVRGNRS